MPILIEYRCLPRCHGALWFVKYAFYHAVFHRCECTVSSPVRVAYLSYTAGARCDALLSYGLICADYDLICCRTQLLYE